MTIITKYSIAIFNKLTTVEARLANMGNSYTITKNKSLGLIRQWDIRVGICENGGVIGGIGGCYEMYIAKRNFFR